MTYSTAKTLSTAWSTTTEHSIFQITGTQYTDGLKGNTQQSYIGRELTIIDVAGQRGQVFLKQ